MGFSVVIPNYNGKHLLEKNLPQVLRAVGDAQIIVVDDGSKDGSVELIKKKFPRIIVLEKVTRSGFATSVNLGVKAATGEVVLLLNSDVVPDKDFVKPLLSHFKDEKVFGVGCLDESIEGGQKVKRGRGIGTFIRGMLVHSRGEVDKSTTLWVNGGSGAYRKSIWEKLGGLDEMYDPFYWEDIDLGYRALKSGYQLVFEPRSVVEHRHEEGSIKSQFSKKHVEQIAYRNQFMFIWKNVTDTDLWIRHLAWVPYTVVTQFFKGNLPFIFGLCIALTKLGSVLQKRAKNVELFKLTDKKVIQLVGNE